MQMNHLHCEKKSIMLKKVENKFLAEKTNELGGCKQ